MPNTKTVSIAQVAHSIGASMTASRSVIQTAMQSVMDTLKVNATAYGKPLVQGSDEHSELRKAITAELVAAGNVQAGAQVDAANMSKVFLFATNGFDFSKAGNMQAALAAIKADTSAKPYWTNAKKSGAKPKDAEKSGKVTDIKAIIGTLSGDEIFSVLSDAQKIAIYLATCTEKKVKANPKVSA